MDTDGHGMMNCKCNIPNGGYCRRHKVRKIAHWVNLCQTRPDYFQLWEEGRGPGQILAASTSRHKDPDRAMPPAATMARNVARDGLRFIKDLCRTVSTEHAKARLKVCQECDLFNRRRGRCSKCGCQMKLKSKGRVWTCPMGCWDDVDRQFGG